MQNENAPHNQKTFLPYYVLILVTTNFIGIAWALQPQSISGYISLLFVPVNVLFLLFGVLWVLMLQRRKLAINYLLHYAVVILLPLILQKLFFVLIDAYARKGGC